MGSSRLFLYLIALLPLLGCPGSPPVGTAPKVVDFSVSGEIGEIKVSGKVVDPDSEWVEVTCNDVTKRVAPGETFELPASRGHVGIALVDSEGNTGGMAVSVD